LEGKESVKFASIQDIGPNLQVLLSSELGKIAAALGLTYDQLTGDLSQVNFSSIRAGLNEFRIRTEIVQRFTIINLGLEPITSRWLEMLPLYVPKLSAQGIYPKFSLPRRYGVDELKDAQADLLEVQAGFNTMENALEERDRTFQEVLAEREKISKTGYVFTSIPLVAQGTPNTQPTKVADQNNAGISDGTTSNPNSTAGAGNDTSGD
jgi:capsid protein